MSHRPWLVAGLVLAAVAVVILAAGARTREGRLVAIVLAVAGLVLVLVGALS